MREEIIRGVKASLGSVKPGSKDDGAMKSTLLATAVMARHMGFSREETMSLFKDEWRHMTAIDDRTVVKVAK
jgi:hypothetical protein